MIKYLAYTAIIMFVLYAVFRLLGTRAISRLVEKEIDEVVNGEEYKVKGRFE
ncbi:hypothetical protein J4211_00025 [Candidatus Woesearchaeota archaeon]|nr:hypothetical protein [Candidatus Woesearchaeota archaeon]